MPRLAVIATLACACLASPAGAQLFKCQLADGRTAYQDSKCEDTAKSSVLPTSPAIAATAPSDCTADYLPKVERGPRGVMTPESQRTRNELQLVVELASNYEGCAADVPGFSARFAGSYREWREKFRDAVARFEANPAARRVASCRTEREAIRVRGSSAHDKEQKSAACMQMIGPLIEQLNREGMPQ